MNGKLILLLTVILTSTQTQAFNLEAIGNASNAYMFDTRSCNELYVQATTLEKQTYLDKHDYYTDSNAQMAGVAYTFFAPAIYYFGYAVYKDFDSKSKSKTASQEIETIRVRMAEKRCFDR